MLHNDIRNAVKLIYFYTNFLNQSVRKPFETQDASAADPKFFFNSPYLELINLKLISVTVTILFRQRNYLSL